MAEPKTSPWPRPFKQNTLARDGTFYGNERMKKTCCQCEATGPVDRVYGFDFCSLCRSQLGLHTDKTIQKNASLYRQAKSVAYEVEVLNRLHSMEKDYIKKRVKLLHILARLDELDRNSSSKKTAASATAVNLMRNTGVRGS